jgi:hypothetical protein
MAVYDPICSKFSRIMELVGLRFHGLFSLLRLENCNDNGLESSKEPKRIPHTFVDDQRRKAQDYRLI